MAREKFQSRTLTGNLKVACKFDDGTVRYWEADKMTVIKRIVKIINEYSAEGYVLTLRQLHYQLVSNNWIVNHTTAYKKLGAILDDCRYAGIIDWDDIEDRGRIPYIHYSADDIADGLSDLSKQYMLNRQEGQSNYIELWTEKDALSGIFRRSTDKYHIQLVVNKGYTSSSAVYNAYKRVAERILKDEKVTILYFGDHDPSGLDMIRDIRERIMLMLGNGTELMGAFFEKAKVWGGDQVLDVSDLVRQGYLDIKVYKKWQRNTDNPDANQEICGALVRMYIESEGLFKVLPIGLTMDQIEEYNLPPNPAKLTDTRSDKYIAKFGNESWEVDALKPQVLTEIVESNIERIIDMDTFEAMVEKENGDLEELNKLVKDYSER